MIMIVTEQELKSKVIKDAYWDAAFVIVQEEDGKDMVWKSRSFDVEASQPVSPSVFQKILMENREWYNK
jgi:hypothetical protein